MKRDILVVIPHPWLRQVVVSIFGYAKMNCVCVESVAELGQAIHTDTAIAIIDVFSYPEYYRDILAQIKEKNLGIAIIALVSIDNTEYQYGLMTAGASAVVVKEKADEQLIPALIQVLQDKKRNDTVARLLKNQKQFITLFKEEVSELNNEEQMSSIKSKLTRRTFLKASAVTAVAAGTVAANPWGTAMKALAQEDVESASVIKDKIVAGVCRGNCFGGCLLNVHVRNGKVVQTSMREMPNPEYNRICVKGLTHVQRIYSKDRLKYPMKRAGERGEGKWERISWDEAITTITDKWKEYQSQYGKNSFSIGWGSGSYGSLSGVGIGNPVNRLLNVSGSSLLNMSVDAAQGLSGTNALGLGPNFNMNEAADFKNAKTIFCWGANPVNAQQQTMHFLVEARDNGTKFIVIDPVYNGTAARADMFVPVRPGSDGALALGMMNIVVRENWIDEPFLKKSTVAPFLVKESDGKYLRQSDLGVLVEGALNEPIVWDSTTNTHSTASVIANPALRGSYTINGIKVTTAYDLLLERIAEYPPEKAAEICNIPVDTIEEITRIYATNKPSTIYQNFGIDHYVNGHYAIFAIYALAMITGNLAKSGACCGMGLITGLSAANIFGTLFPPGAAPALEISQLKLSEVLETKMYGNTPVDLKGVYFTHVNFAGNRIDRRNTLEALKKLDFIAVADMNMNETAQYADILLPVAHWFELDDIFISYSAHPYVLLQEKAVEPLYECKSDFEIVKLLADKLGHGNHFAMDETEYMKLWLDSDGAKGLGITLERLQKEKAVRCLPGELFIHGEGGVFPTPTGRAQFYLESPAPNLNYGQQFDIAKERLPYHEPPHEAWHENPLHEKYPFSVIQDHTRWRTHSQWWDVAMLKELEPEPTLKINSVDASPRNIKTGDIVKVFNDRGHVLIKAIINDAVQPGVLTMPKGWEKQEFIDGHYQDLTSRVTNPVCANSAFFDLLVGVEKV